MPEPLDAALGDLRTILLDPQRLVRAIAAGRRRGSTASWRRAELRPVQLKAGPALQVVRYDDRQAHTRNPGYGDEAATAVDELLGEPFATWYVETTDETRQVRVTKKGDAQVHRASAQRPAVAGAHDRAKVRMVDPADPFLLALGLTTKDGQVKPSRRDKYRQVEEFVRALAPALDDAAPAMAHGKAGTPTRVVDLGCGNAYLTFAAYRFLTAARGMDVDLVGVDVRAQAREHNSDVASQLGWERLRFVEGTIIDAPVKRADLVLALHACDTATDDALARAVRWRAALVLAAPCCHHDIQRQLREAGGPPDPYGPLVRHGILRERFADVLTDALRAALLRLLGYRVEVVEFVDSAHTPRNVMLRAVRTGAAPTSEQVAEYRALTSQWHVTPRLEQLLADELAPVLV